MSFYRGMTGENVTIKGDKGTPITKPSGPGPGCAARMLTTARRAMRMLEYCCTILRAVPLR